MDEKTLQHYREKFSTLSDEQLLEEYDCLNHDGTFLFRDEDLEYFSYYERETAIFDELRKRGLKAGVSHE